MHTDLYEYFDAGFLAIAHRGGALLPANRGQENTLAAFRRAVEMGYTHLETDVHASRDGVLYAFHDDDLTRMTGQAAKIGDLTSTQIDAISVGGEPIPRLADVLSALPDTYVNIDMKADAAMLPLAALVCDPQVAPRVCVASFSTTRLESFRQEVGPSVATALTRREVLACAYAPRALSVMRWLAQCPGVVAQIPLRFTAAGVSIPVYSPRLLAMAHGTGKHVHLWTIDDPHLMRRLRDDGVDGIITDRPDELARVLSE